MCGRGGQLAEGEELELQDVEVREREASGDSEIRHLGVPQVSLKSGWEDRREFVLEVCEGIMVTSVCLLLLEVQVPIQVEWVRIKCSSFMLFSWTKGN